MNNKPYYWDDPAWYEKRNKGILRDKKSGMSNSDLVSKYKISQGRILTIIQNSRPKKQTFIS